MITGDREKLHLRLKDAHNKQGMGLSSVVKLHRRPLSSGHRRSQV